MSHLWFLASHLQKTLNFWILANLFYRHPHLLFVQLKCHIWGLGAVQNYSLRISQDSPQCIIHCRTHTPSLRTHTPTTTMPPWASRKTPPPAAASGSNSNNDEQDEDEDLHVLPTNQKGVVKAALWRLWGDKLCQVWHIDDILFVCVVFKHQWDIGEW